jgi:hypothetical protein
MPFESWRIGLDEQRTSGNELRRESSVPVASSNKRAKRFAHGSDEKPIPPSRSHKRSDWIVV